MAKGRSFGDRIAGTPTGAKIFLTLIGALLPLAVTSVIASISASRQAGEEAKSQLRVAASESSRNLAIELVGDMTALTSAMNALAADPGDTPSCARVQGVFAQQSATGAGFFIADRTGRLLCGAPLPVAAPDPVAGGPAVSRILPDQGLVMSVAAAGGGVRGSAFFPTALLTAIARPSAFAVDHEETLKGSGPDVLVLRALTADNLLDNHRVVPAPLGIGDLTIEFRMRTSVVTLPILIAMILPILMWVAAASIAWFVVDRLLIRPLRMLRGSVAAYQPGSSIDVGMVRALPAQEIRELGETFRSLSRTLALHEAGLAEGLVRQTRLTREVHHRVKNNLQVISSLINLHARAAKNPDVLKAYASIQRRVDALSVVHRHHFAELEDNRGLSLRAVIGELASNIRASAPENTAIGILIDVEPFLVTQDNAIAVAFLLTEIIELASAISPVAQFRISVRTGDAAGTAILRVASPALVEGEAMRSLLTERYGRVMEGLARQLRAPLHHDPLSGAYEIALAVTGRD